MKFIQILTVVAFLVTHCGSGKCGICEMHYQEEEGRRYPPFGREMRSEFFMEPDLIFLNHGSYGTYPKTVSVALHEYQKSSEQNLDRWFRRDVWPELTKVREMLAALISANSEDIVMVPNTTGGMNAILRSIVFAAGERILHLSTIFPAMGSIIQYIVDSSQGDVSKVVFNVTYPMTNEEFLTKFEAFLEEIHDPTKPIRIALIDHITSVPAVVNPIDRIIPMLKERNITVLIDGAHGIGQVPINITALAPDYYVTNCNKWLYTARGCAVLYVDKRHQSTIHPAHINAAYRQPADFQNEFSWIGSMDYSMYMTVPAALQFRKDIGGENAIMQHNHNLAFAGGLRMADLFGTEVLQSENQIGSMVDVQLPIENIDNPKLLIRGWWVQIQLNNYPETFAPVYKHNDKFWTRACAQIYNDLSDFEKLAEHFLTIIRVELDQQQNHTLITSNLIASNLF